MDPLSASNYTSTSNKGREPAVLPHLRAVAAIAASNLLIGAGAFDGDVGRLHLLLEAGRPRVGVAGGSASWPRSVLPIAATPRVQYIKFFTAGITTVLMHRSTVPAVSV